MKNYSAIGYQAVVLIITCISLTSARNIINYPCTTPDSMRGSCIHVEQCTHLYNLLLRHSQSKKEIKYLLDSQCDFRDRIVWVCCAVRQNPNRPTLRNNVEKRMTKNVKQAKLPEPATCRIQTIANRIYGGTETEINEYPWMVLIEYSNGDQKKHSCGGSLINERYVLTAAHCIIGLPKDWTPTQVRLGEWDTRTNPDCNGVNNCADPHLDVAIEKTIVHERYEILSKSKPNDIALLRLAHSITYTDYIRPICLPLAEHLKQPTLSGDVVYVSGWGRTEQFSRSNVKLKAEVTTVSLSNCQRVYSPPNYNITSSQVCAGGEKNIDTCDGDSGGGIIGIDSINRTLEYYFIAGIVSFGPDPCGYEGWPGVYTSVSKYVDWIQTNMEP